MSLEQKMVGEENKELTEISVYMEKFIFLILKSDGRSGVGERNYELF